MTAKERGDRMSFLVILLIWFIAPVVELAVIVALCLTNQDYKRKNQELSQKLNEAIAVAEHIRAAESIEDTEKEIGQTEDQVADGEEDRETKREEYPNSIQEQPVYSWKKAERQETTWQETAQQETIRQETAQQETVHQSANQQEIIQQESMQKKSREGILAIAALLIGIVFVVLAGLIFATATWNLLPDLCKVGLAAFLSLLFFAVSILAERKLNIYRTGNAFYLLGSIFLFLTVLAAGYFRLFGPGFILEGTNRWRVLLAGSLVTVSMMFLGIKRFHHPLYTHACFWGLTVTMTYFLAACEADFRQMISGMMVYASLLAIAETIWERKRQLTKITEKAAEAVKAAEAEKMAEAEKNQKPAKEKCFGELLSEGAAGFVPLHFWIFVFVMSWQGVWDVLFLLSRPSWHGAAAMAAMTAAMVIQALYRKNIWAKRLFSLALAETVHYAIMWGYEGISLKSGLEASDLGVGDPMFGIALLAASSIVAVCFLAGRRKRFCLRTATGDGIYTAVLGINTLCLTIMAAFSWLIWRNGHPECLLAAAGGCVLLAGTAGYWGKKYPLIRTIIPFILMAAVILLHGAFAGGYWIFDDWIGDGILRNWIDKGLPEFLLLVALAVWDWRYQYDFVLPLFFLGIFAQLISVPYEEVSLPFALLLSGYLLALAGKNRGKEDGGKIGKAASFTCFVGVYFLMYPFTADNVVLRIAAVIWVYVIWMSISYKMGSRSAYWDICGEVLLVGTLVGFYLDPQKEVGKVLLCLAVYGGFTLMFYWGKNVWPHLLSSLLFLPMPFVLSGYYSWTEGQQYAVVASVYLLTGIVSRYCCPIAKRTRNVIGGWRVDWHHIMAAFVLLFMAFEAEKDWRFGWLVLIAVYFLQFLTVEKESGKKAALTAASAAAVMAFWCQPFIDWPSVLELEIRLLAAVLFLFGLGYIWPAAEICLKNKRGVYLQENVWQMHSGGEGQEKAPQVKESARAREIFQTIGYLVCLAVLCADAVRTGNLTDALIVEGLCLLVFIGSQVKKCLLWVRVSGTVIVVAALYMTKDFWLNISWWVYLLLAGIGLILFAAVKEKKRKSGDNHD